MQQDLTARIARYVCDLQLADLPADVMHKAKDVFLDGLGGQLACSTLPHCRMVSRRGREAGVPTPTNDAVVEVRRRIDRGDLTADRSSIDLLWKLSLDRAPQGTHPVLRGENRA